MPIHNQAKHRYYYVITYSQVEQMVRLQHLEIRHVHIVLPRPQQLSFPDFLMMPHLGHAEFMSGVAAAGDEI